MWHAADIAHTLQEAYGYGFRETLPDYPKPKFDWGYLAERRDAYIRRLNGIYERNLEKDKVEYLTGYGQLVDRQHVKVTPVKTVTGEDGLMEEVTISADHIMIAAGGSPTIPSDDEVPGASLGIDSDGFFALRKQPARALVIGAGYIAVELAGTFNSLGTETHLSIRHDSFLRNFDSIIGDTIKGCMESSGLKIHPRTNVKKIEGQRGGPLDVHFCNGEKVQVDCVLWAIGRHPNVKNLGLETVGIKTDTTGIVADEYQNTNVEGIYSLGDIAGKAELTPVAIAAGRRLSNRLFGPPKFANDHLDYNNIPTAIFSEPTCGSVGLSEPDARLRYGDDKITIYKTRFTPMYYSVLDKKAPAAYKIVCAGEDEKVVGVHMVGMGSDEVIQAVGIAVKMGATKKDFDDTVAVHPTCAEGAPQPRMIVLTQQSLSRPTPRRSHKGARFTSVRQYAPSAARRRQTGGSCSSNAAGRCAQSRSAAQCPNARGVLARPAAMATARLAAAAARTWAAFRRAR